MQPAYVAIEGWTKPGQWHIIKCTSIDVADQVANCHGCSSYVDQPELVQVTRWFGIVQLFDYTKSITPEDQQRILDWDENVQGLPDAKLCFDVAEIAENPPQEREWLFVL